MYYRTLRCPKEIGCEADETEFVISAVKRHLLLHLQRALEKSRAGQSFERRWKEFKEAAQRVVEKFPIILADEVELRVEGKVPEKLGLRAWKKDGKIHVLLVNATRETMSLDFKLSEVGSIRNPLAPLEVRFIGNLK